MKDYIEVLKHEDDFYNNYPKILDSDFDHHARLALVDAYGLIFDGDDSPVLFVRHGNPNGYRFGAFSRLNRDPFGVQTPLHDNDIAQKEETGPFKKISDNPLVYGYGTTEPFSEYRYYSNYATWKETDILEVVVEPFPYCIVQHQGEIAKFTEIIQPCIAKGLFNGKEIKFIASYDKVYMPDSKKTDIGSDMAYILVLDHGIRPDGLKESVVIYINENGKSMGCYYLEDEKPVVSTDVKMEAEWYHQKYVDDGTVFYKDATFYIGNKVIHFKGKWGSKGITAQPRYNKHGQSQIFGTWYEGEVPYQHVLFTSFHENMEAYDYKFRKLGYNIKD